MTLLVVDGDAKHREAITRVLAGVSNGSAAGRLLTADALPAAPGESYDLIIANADTLGIEDAALLLRAYPELCARGRILVVTNAADRSGLARLFGEHGLSNVLARDESAGVEDLVVTVEKMLGGDPFGPDRYFAPRSTKREVVVTSSEQREHVLVEALEFARGVGAQGRFAEVFSNACDELVTNALYNAPVDHVRRPRFAHLPRTVPVTLGSREEIAVTFICDGRRMGISVLDRFGSLEAGTITQHLAKCLRRGTDQVDDKAGGAGLGLYCVFEAVSHFVVNIEPGQRTEGIGLLDIGQRYKDFVQKGKSVNIFVARAA